MASSTGTVAIGASSSKPAMVTAGGASASSASSGAASAARHPAPQQTQLSGASPTAASTSRSAATAPMRRSWNAYRGSTLRATVTDWCRISGFELEWVPFDLDYPIASPLHFEGSFEQAVFDLFHLYEKADRSFLVDGYTKGQKRLVITENKKSSKGVHQ